MHSEQSQVPDTFLNADPNPEGTLLKGVATTGLGALPGLSEAQETHLTASFRLLTYG